MWLGVCAIFDAGHQGKGFILFSRQGMPALLWSLLFHILNLFIYFLFKRLIVSENEVAARASVLSSSVRCFPVIIIVFKPFVRHRTYGVLCVSVFQ